MGNKDERSDNLTPEQTACLVVFLPGNATYLKHNHHA